MPTPLTEVTELATALGTLAPDLSSALATKSPRLQHVSDVVWERLVATFNVGTCTAAFERAFANGAALLWAEDGLRNRPPKVVEWKGQHRPPGDDVIPADIRIDHVYQVSCKYLSRIVHNLGPARLFDHLLVGEVRARSDWFGVVAPAEYQAFYDCVRSHAGGGLPAYIADLSVHDRAVLKEVLKERLLPAPVQETWGDLCGAVTAASASRWRANLMSSRTKLRLLWRLLRIGDAPYFVLGTDGANDIRLRVASAWDWMQAYELRGLEVSERVAGQPEVGWLALIRERDSGADVQVNGHVEVRWSHGRFQGAPEAKVYLDTPLHAVPGYFALR